MSKHSMGNGGGDPCSEKVFTVRTDRPCPGSVGEGGGQGSLGQVDLVVLIDTSISMQDEAKALGDAAEEAVAGAEDLCEPELRHTWLTIEGSEQLWKNAGFTETHRDYLVGLGVKPGDLLARPAGQPPHDAPGQHRPHREDAAFAMIDIVRHFDWRPGACKAIFFLGDEGLAGGWPENQTDILAASQLIAEANAQGVAIFMYQGTPVSAGPQHDPGAEYQRVADQTGGIYFKHPASNLGGFPAIFEKVICNACGTECRSVALPEIAPCFELRWGDGSKDQIETDDVEVLCITACNPYSNIALHGVTVDDISVEMADGSPVPTLPDGTQAVTVHPSGPLCFGDLDPCDEEGGRTCAHQELVLVSRGAEPGDYRVMFEYDFALHHEGAGDTTADLTLVLS